MQSISKHLTTIALIALISACASTPPASYKATQTPSHHQDQALALDLDPSTPLSIHGVFVGDVSKLTPAILYQGGAGAAGFLAQIAVHGGMASSAQKAREQKIQDAADEFLAPIRNELSMLTLADLRSEKINALFTATDTADAALIVTPEPIFFVAQNKKSLTLLSSIEVTTNQKKPNSLYINRIELTVPITPEMMPQAPWNTAQRAIFVHKLQSMLQNALHIARLDFHGKLAPLEHAKARNHRYHQGEKLRVERGTEIHTSAKLTIIRNLRGWIVAFPRENKAS